MIGEYKIKNLQWRVTLSDVLLVRRSGCARLCDAQDAQDYELEQTGSIVWNNYNIDGVKSNWCCLKNVIYTFCNTSFTGRSSFRAFAHILGRAVLDQKDQMLQHAYKKRG
jgi:deoxyhypusine synthase